MSHNAITVSGLGKCYKLGETLEHDTLRDHVVGALRRIGGRAPRADAGSGNLWALKDVNFDVKPGEVLGIIGHNGAGKSTLLKLLSRITEPTEGEIRLRGRIASLLEVGTGFHPELSGRENIYLNGAILGMTKGEIDSKFDEIVDFAQVGQFLTTPVKRYSSGMYVRLAFAVAAHLEPEILLVDEVLAVGDAEFQKRCLGKMEDVAAQDGRTILFVSHNMTAIRNLCQRVIHIRRGQVAGIGTAEEMIAEYFSVAERGKQIGGEVSVQLGEKLRLHEFKFSPDPVDSGEPLDFELVLGSDEDVKITDLCILVYNMLGARVGILDLRNADEKGFRVTPDKPLRIEGTVKSFPVVEGEYKIGLYLSCIHYWKDFMDLATVTVTQTVREGRMVPRKAQHRGVLEFDYDFDWS